MRWHRVFSFHTSTGALPANHRESPADGHGSASVSTRQRSAALPAPGPRTRTTSARSSRPRADQPRQLALRNGARECDQQAAIWGGSSSRAPLRGRRPSTRNQSNRVRRTSARLFSAELASDQLQCHDPRFCGTPSKWNIERQPSRPASEAGWARTAGALIAVRVVVSDENADDTAEEEDPLCKLCRLEAPVVRLHVAQEKHENQGAKHTIETDRADSQRGSAGATEVCRGRPKRVQRGEP